MSQQIEAITEKVQESSRFISAVLQEVDRVMVGQKSLIERLILGLLTGEHLLLEGVPGLAKTTSVKTLAQTIRAQFKRIQFTPDLLPADLLGTQVYQPKTGDFVIKKGPLFANIVLADEINRAPAKVQSALLEAMQERQITLGGQTFLLEEPFMVIATQNPIEQEGTYPLPEAQVDRFMLKLHVDYPTKEEEKLIMQRMAASNHHSRVQPVVDPSEMVRARRVFDQIYIDDNLQDYILDLVACTRHPEAYHLSSLTNLIQYGASPRASIYLHRVSKAYAFMKGRGYVVPHDIKTIGLDVLRHRILLTYEAEAENITPDDILRKIFDTIEVP
ncbi:MAG: AAA domain-containing protein [Nitrospinaceae bacterium]|nr:MoxR family ATPase [Nitrospinaceae bacterium]NIR57988.1 MoxR family ATPase [Nitrospinaceae bacterium]NIS88450.1 MoxR family ATPase [Nitrospinaceae bacterium]NIT85330.1 MoxR family ATPase [Nitrospinaceae bacterium]NIU47481.1 MoxR family ATPase [Nitrospinaceae bacterium]